jgi:uncharacterized protein HemY
VRVLINNRVKNSKVNIMKYLFSIEAASQMENMEEAKKELVELVEQTS